MTVDDLRQAQIRELHVRAVKVQMAELHRTASGVITELPLVLTDVVTADGITGYSYVFCYTLVALKPAAALVKNLEALIVGQPAAPLEIEKLLQHRFWLLGPQGLTGIAMAAIDMALWDALARAHALLLARLLCGICKPIPAYGAVGYDGAAGSARVAAQWAAKGFKGVKAKFGYPDVREDIAVIMR